MLDLLELLINYSMMVTDIYVYIVYKMLQLR